MSIAIVGGGWAGLAAAVALADAGAIRAGDAITLFEAAPALGGRARAVSLTLAGRRVELDNGQHLMLGAYRDCLRLIERVAGAESAVLHRRRMRLSGTAGLSLAAAPLPAPLHLLGALIGARGLSIGDRLSMITMMARLTLARWRTPHGLTVAALLQRHRQPPRLVQAIWEPLCVGALNTPMEHACARSFCAVLRDSLGGSARASDFLLPQRTLSDVLPRPAERWLRAHGVTVHLQSPVRSVSARDDHWWIDAGGRSQAVRDVILALPPHAAARVLSQVTTGSATRAIEARPCAAGEAAPEPREGAQVHKARAHAIEEQAHANEGPAHAPGAVTRADSRRWSRDETGVEPRATRATNVPDVPGTVALLERFEYERIATVYVAWSIEHAPMLDAWSMLEEDPARHHYGQWIFDRGEIDGLRVASIVISARGRAADLDDRALGHAAARQLVAQLGCRMPDDHRVIVEKRATFRCTPDRPRPDAVVVHGPGPRLILAGDYLVPDYPATLESAVRSGMAAARAWSSGRIRPRRDQVSQATDNA